MGIDRYALAAFVNDSDALDFTPAGIDHEVIPAPVDRFAAIVELIGKEEDLPDLIAEMDSEELSTYDEGLSRFTARQLKNSFDDLSDELKEELRRNAVSISVSDCMDVGDALATDELVEDADPFIPWLFRIGQFLNG